ncbi:L-selectin-like [Sander lucioperca]|uniref:L-selectin-like n=1 Tax=Sander lucioperca TaxID=283035 RepID=UPI001653566E|nr:L-selectin-like [Sander lucioperca]
MAAGGGTVHILLSEEGWEISTCLLHQYHYVAAKKTWAEAQAYCRKTYTDLAIIRNSEEINQLISTVASFGSNVWIGLYTQLNPEYVVMSQKMNWSSAQRYCRENFIDLATVRNDSENQKVLSLGQSKRWTWIGLFRDPNLYWSDGSGYSFSYWSTGPFTIGSTRACVLALPSTGKWKTTSCETRLPFVCYSVPAVMRQTIKLRMKPGDPSLDLNDPAVKADILKKAPGQDEEEWNEWSHPEVERTA